jgi:hypothetical protein
MLTSGGTSSVVDAVTYTGTGASAMDAVAEKAGGDCRDQAKPPSSPRPMSAPTSARCRFRNLG